MLFARALHLAGFKTSVVQWEFYYTCGLVGGVASIITAIAAIVAAMVVLIDAVAAIIAAPMRSIEALPSDHIDHLVLKPVPSHSFNGQCRTRGGPRKGVPMKNTPPETSIKIHYLTP